MELKVIRLEIAWPSNVPLRKLRSYLISQLTNYGEPLRWAITAVRLSELEKCSRQLDVEAVVITP